MGKNKLIRFRENEEKYADIVLQPSREEILNGLEYKGKWNTKFFNNGFPIVLELGCGRGEYAVSLAKKNPHYNFIGIDTKGARIWEGAKQTRVKNLNNVAFIKTQIELIDELFEENEITEIWLTFPDPQIKYRRTKHRLTHPNFLVRYKKILTEKGLVHLKTDSEFLHGYTLGILQEIDANILLTHHNIYENLNIIPKEVTDTKTYYEKMFLEQNKPITYLQFTF